MLFELFPLPFVNYEGGTIDLMTNVSQIAEIKLGNVPIDFQDMNGFRIELFVKSEAEIENLLFPQSKLPDVEPRDRKSSDDNQIIQMIITLTHAGLRRREILEEIRLRFRLNISEHDYRSLRVSASKIDENVGRAGRKRS